MNEKASGRQIESHKPSDIFGRFRQEIDELISGFSKRLPDQPFSHMFNGNGFAVDVSENDKQVEILAELPGLEPNDIDVSLEGGNLRIAAQKKTETKSESKNWHRVERTSGAFSRVVPLGFVPDPDKVEAKLEKGVLQIVVPKPANPSQASRKIAVKKV